MDRHVVLDGFCHTSLDPMFVRRLLLGEEAQRLRTRTRAAAPKCQHCALY